MAYFVLLKKKGASRWSGAIPGKKSATRSSLENLIKTKLSNSYSAKVISGTQMSALISKSRLRLPTKKVSKKRPSVGRTTKKR